eukprot:gene33997-41142_t
MEAPGKLEKGKSSQALAAMIRARTTGLVLGPPISPTNADAATGRAVSPISPVAALRAGAVSPSRAAAVSPPRPPVATATPTNAPPPAAAPRSSSPPPPPSLAPPPPPKHAPAIISIETMMQRTQLASEAPAPPTPPPAAAPRRPSPPKPTPPPVVAPPAPKPAPSPKPAPAPTPAAPSKPATPPVKSVSPAAAREDDDLPAPASAPAAPSKYTPKVVVATGEKKCHICKKSVYKMEEMIAIGEVWHSACFCCGAGGEVEGCGKVLGRTGYLDHHGAPYCQACYSKLFRPKGFGYGNTLNTDYGDGNRATSPARAAA